MSAVRPQFKLVAIMLVALMSHFVTAQDPRDQEKRNVPTEVRARLDLYYELFEKEDWEKLYEIEDWLNPDKKSYISTKIKFKGNTYSSVSKLIKVGLSDSMTYHSHGNKWRIEGCGKFRDKNDSEITSIGSVSVSRDTKRGWIVQSFIPSLYADGWRGCTTPIDEFPIRILGK
jgi:hypothetical protein